MFDRYLVPQRAPDVHVHNDIKQLPHDTADAARLYGEMRDRAEREVANALVDHLGADNEITVVRIESMVSMERGGPVTRLLFKINGYMHDVTVQPDRSELEKQAYNSVADTIAREILRHLISKRIAGTGK